MKLILSVERLGMKSILKQARSFFYFKKAQQETLREIPSSIVKECLAYLDGRPCSEEIQKRIEHYLNDDPCLSKKEAVEMLLDFEERKLKDS